MAEDASDNASSASSAVQHDTTKISLSVGDSGTRKRTRDVGSSTDLSETQPSTEVGRKTSDERASKKARMDTESERGLEKVMMNICLKRIKRGLEERNKDASFESAKGLMSRHLSNIFHRLKNDETGSYEKHLKQLQAACKARAAAKARVRKEANNDELCNAGLRHAANELTVTALKNFDQDSLLGLDPFLEGNGQWQTVLYNLQLPLTDVRNTEAALHLQREKNKSDQELEIKIKNLLKWLTLPESCTSPSVSPSYNDVSSRHNHDTVMRVDLEPLTAQQEKDFLLITTKDSRANYLQRREGLAPQPHNSGPHITVDHSEALAAVKQTVDQFSTLVTSLPEMISSNINAAAGAFHAKNTQSSDPASNPTEAPAEEQTPEPSILATTTPTEMGNAQREVPNEEDVAEAPRQELQRRLIEQSAHNIHTSDTFFRKIEIRFQNYDVAIEQLKAFQHGGPHPTNLLQFQVPDVKACYYRLVQIWGDLKIEELYDIEELRTDPSSFYPFAIGLREAHFLLHALVYYGDRHTALALTGWSLNHMRWLQWDMTPFAYDVPFIHLKLDVDMICAALGFAFPNQERLERPPKPTKDTSTPNQQFSVPQGYVCTTTGQFIRIAQPLPVAQAQHRDNVQSAVNYATSQVQTNMIAPTHVQVPAPAYAVLPQQMSVDVVPDAMEVSQVCPEFRKNICKQYDTCRFDHPESERKIGQLCHGIKNSGQCRWGLGCSFDHSIVAPSATIAPPAQNAVSTAIATQLPAFLSTGSGNVVDTELPDSYCNNWTKGVCKKDNCTRLHMLDPNQQSRQQGILEPSNAMSNFSDVNYYQNGRQEVQAVQQTVLTRAQIANSKIKCKFEKNGRPCTKASCEYLHTNLQSARIRGTTVPQVVHPSYEDAAMGDSTPNGDTGNLVLPGWPPKSEIPCRYENPETGKACTNMKCEYKHTYVNSKLYGHEPYIQDGWQQAWNNGHLNNENGNRGRDGGRGGRGGVRGGGQRATNNHTFDPQLHAVQFQAPQQGHQVQPPQNGIDGQWHHDLALQNVRLIQPDQQQHVPQNQQNNPQGHRDNGRQNKTKGHGRGDKQCHGCGKVGHFKRECPDKNGGGSMGPPPIPPTHYNQMQGGHQCGGYRAGYAESFLHG